MPLRALRRELRRSWQLTVLNRLRLGRFSYPDLVVFLRIDPDAALARIRARGRPLQAHETAAFLTELDRAYERVCTLLEQRRGLPVVRLRVDELSSEETVDRVVTATHAQLARLVEPDADREAVGRIDVIATTMSGSIEDQRKVGRIGPEFRARTPGPCACSPRTRTRKRKRWHATPCGRAAACSSPQEERERSTPSSRARISMGASRRTCGSPSCARARPT